MRKRTYKRYVGDLKSPDVATPRRAKRSLLLAKSTVERQRKQIINLQQKNRRLMKRVTTLKQLLSELRTKNLITEQAEDNIMVSLIINNWYDLLICIFFLSMFDMWRGMCGMFGKCF